MNPLLFNDPNEANQALFGTYGFDPRGNNEIGTMLQRFAMYLYPEAARELEFMGTLGGQRRSSILDFLTQMNDPGALAADRQAYANQAYESAGQGGNLLAMQLQGSGYGDGARQGAVEGQYQGAQRSVNQFNSQQMSPQARLQRIMASMGAIEQGMRSPALGSIQSMFAPVEQRAAQNAQDRQSNNWLSGILGTVGQAAGGGGFGSLLGRPQARPNPMLLNQNPGENYL